MPQCLLVLHALEGLGPAARKAFFDAIFEASPAHWPIHASATLVATGLSPAYLRDHLRRALDAESAPEVQLLVCPIAGNPAWAGLPPEGEAWLRDVLADG
jgi:hypothetical protein